MIYSKNIIEADVRWTNEQEMTREVHCEHNITGYARGKRRGFCVFGIMHRTVRVKNAGSREHIVRHLF
jgi:hypothetical protein